jgi:hypothetical protein
MTPLGLDTPRQPSQGLRRPSMDRSAATAPPATTLSVVLIEAAPSGSAPDCLQRALAQGLIAEIVRAVGPFEGLFGAFADAVGRCTGDLVLAVTPDMHMPDEAWPAVALAAREHPDAEAFTLNLQGLDPDPAWRGRRCRSHERNLESLRFANLLAPGAFVARRSAMQAALAELPADIGADWWRALTGRIAASAHVADIDTTLTRSRRLAGEPAYPSFAAPSPRRPRVLVLGQIEVSASLYFDFLESSPEVSVAFRPLTRLGMDAQHLAAADLVILVRELHRFWDEGVIALLTAVGVPFVYFTDDNFLALQAEGGASRFYSPRRMRRALAAAAEVWTSTEALAAAHQPLHRDVRVWGPVLDPVLQAPPRAPGDILTVAVAGGDFRLAGLDGDPIGRLQAISEARDLRLVVTQSAAKALAPALTRAEIVALPMERSFRQFVRRWRRYAPDVLLHPAGATTNAPFKCPTAVIVAGYLGAVPVVADEPAYDGWGEADGVIRLGDEAEGLSRAAGAAHDPAWRGEIGGRLASALAARFHPRGRAALLEAVIAGERPNRQGAGRRGSADAVLASPSFSRRRAELSLARATRWVRALAAP